MSFKGMFQIVNNDGASGFFAQFFFSKPHSFGAVIGTSELIFELLMEGNKTEGLE